MTQGGRPAPSLTAVLFLTFGVALALRLLVALRTHALYPDGAVELWMAESLLAGRYAEALATRFHPLTAVLTAALSALSGLGVERAAVGVVALASAAVAPCCGGVAALLTPRSPRRAALVAGLLAAAHPALTRAGGQIMAYGVAHGALALAIVCLALALTRARLRSGAAWALAGGAAVGLGYMARMDALATGAGLGVGLVWAAARAGGARRLALPAAFGVGVLVAMSPFVFALRAQTGVWQLSAKKSVGSVLRVAVPTASSPTAPRAQSLNDLLRAEAGRAEDVPLVARAEAVRFALKKALSAAHPILLVWVGIGLLLAGRGRAPLPPAWALTLLAGAAFVLVHALLKLNWGYTSRLHQSALGVLVVPWAARGIVHLARVGGVSADRSRRRTSILLALALAPLLPKALAPRLAHKALQRDVAASLRLAVGRRSSPATVCGTGEVRPIAWRAGCRFSELPSGPVSEALAAARRAGTTHLVVYLRRRGRRPRALERALALEGVHPIGPPLISQRGRITYTWIVFRL